MVRTQGGSRRATEFLLLLAGAVPVFLIYAMYVINAKATLSLPLLTVPVGLLIAFIVAHIAVRKYAPAADPAVLPLVFVLSGIGITFVTRLVPSLATSQVIWLFVGIAAMVATLILVPNLERLSRYTYTIGLVGIVLLISPMIFGVVQGGSKLWIRVGPFSFQPGEIAKILIVLFLASYLAKNRELLAASTRRFGPFSVPRFRMLTPMFITWGISILVVIFEKDLGSALLFFTIFVVMLYVATGRISYVVISLILFALGAAFCYYFFSHVRVRVQIWLDPFVDASGNGLQLVQSLFSLADGGLIGCGVGRGLPKLIPVVESDFIFAAIGEEMGLFGGAAVLLLFMLFAIRNFATAARAKTDMAAFTTAGLTAALCFQAFLIVGGVTRFLPLTGVTLPFMSQGGSSLLSSFIIVGLLLRAGDAGTGYEALVVDAKETRSVTARIPSLITQSSQRIVHGKHARGRFSLNTPESGVLGRVALGRRLTFLVTFFAVLFASLITNLTYIQVVKAHDYQQMPNNNHTIRKSAYVQRGSILTSDGVILAESVRQQDNTYARTYPQKSLAAHTIGYLSPRYGTTGIEASMNDTLTGHADYSTWIRALYSFAGVNQAGSTVVTTLDSRIQKAAEKTLRDRTGAIVVLNPQTGAVLAKASSPTHSYDDIPKIIANNSSSGELIDRATATRYPPGSTFKVVTLAAALDSGQATLDSPITGPASINIGGGVLTNEGNRDYGDLTLEKALVCSSNTAYGQLAHKLGASTLVNYARAFGFGQSLGQDFSTATSVMPNPEEMSQWETAWSGCGQPVGQHASPAGPQMTVMQGATIAAAIANDGIVMRPHVIDHILSPEGVTTSTTTVRALGQAVSKNTADQLKKAMLSVVQNGTGRTARIAGTKVAGKTGTAQVTHEKINSLFIGFAPYDNPTLAIAICVEGANNEDIEGLAAVLAGEVLSTSLGVQAQGASS